MKAIFITGTDTEVGKTSVSTALLNGFKQQGLTTACMKPIASGCDKNKNGEWQNDDALALQKASSISQSYDQVNPIKFLPPIAPHLAAEEVNQKLTTNSLKKIIQENLVPAADIQLIEGAGGWLVPLNYQETMADVIISLKIPVICVVGIRLGCINHSLLSCDKIRQSGVPFIGWIANCLTEPTAVDKKNISTLEKMIPEPCLGIMPHTKNSDFTKVSFLIDSQLIPDYAMVKEPVID